MGKVTAVRCWDKDPPTKRDSWVMSFGRLLSRGSKEHKEAIVENQRKGQDRQTKILLSQLPSVEDKKKNQ